MLSIGHNSRNDERDARRWMRALNSYRTPNSVRSVTELTITVLPLVALWTAAWFAFSVGCVWASLLIAVPAAGFLVRLFMIQDRKSTRLNSSHPSISYAVFCLK